MTAKQYRAALDRLGFSQLGAAKLFGVGPRTSRRWAAGDADIPETAAILLRLMVAGTITADDILKVSD